MLILKIFYKGLTTTIQSHVTEHIVGTWTSLILYEFEDWYLVNIVPFFLVIVAWCLKIQHLVENSMTGWLNLSYNMKL